MTPTRLLRILRRTVMVLALAGAGYLMVRFDGLKLTLDSPSPLLRFSPGDSLVLDSYPDDLRIDDPVIFAGPDGRVHLALVSEIRQEEGASQFWLRYDAPDCVAPDSQTLGWIGEEWIVGRVIMVWPW